MTARAETQQDGAGENGPSADYMRPSFVSDDVTVLEGADLARVGEGIVQELAESIRFQGVFNKELSRADLSALLANVRVAQAERAGRVGTDIQGASLTRGARGSFSAAEMYLTHLLTSFPNPDLLGVELPAAEDVRAKVLPTITTYCETSLRFGALSAADEDRTAGQRRRNALDVLRGAERVLSTAREAFAEIGLEDIKELVDYDAAVKVEMADLLSEETSTLAEAMRYAEEVALSGDVGSDERKRAINIYYKASDGLGVLVENTTRQLNEEREGFSRRLGGDE